MDTTGSTSAFGDQEPEDEARDARQESLPSAENETTQPEQTEPETTPAGEPSSIADEVAAEPEPEEVTQIQPRAADSAHEAPPQEPAEEPEPQETVEAAQQQAEPAPVAPTVDDEPTVPIQRGRQTAPPPAPARAAQNVAAPSPVGKRTTSGPGNGAHPFDTEDWPAYATPSRPLIPRTIDEGYRRRWNRRRRRYTTFVKRTSRARQAARSASIARAAWASTIVVAALILSVLTASVGAAASYYSSETSQILGLQHSIAAKDSVRIFDSKGVLLYQFNQDGAQHSISLAQIPVNVVNATVAVEDKDFWINQGIDFTSIVRAAQDNLQNQKISQGGSTITQQLIKGQLLGGNVTFTRKLNEAILSIGMTSQGVYTKSQIIEMYLNSIPYSPTAYGIDAAAQEYFGYTDDPSTGMSGAQHLDLAQATMLAGIPQNPNLNDPLLHPDHAHTRQLDVLRAMVANGYITEKQAAQAWAESAKPNFFHPTRTEQNKAPHFVYFVKQQLEDMINTGQLHNLARSGLNVYTTLDMNLQNLTQQAMKDHLYGNDPTGYCCGLVRDANLTNAAAVMADQHTGDVKVMLGSVDYFSTKIDGKFDAATQGYRGPGSSFKPIAYATAFSKGWFPAMTIADMPTAFWDAGAGNAYKPLDFDNTEVRGQLTLRTALQWSLNIPAVKVMQYAGVDNVKAMAERMGVTQWPADATWGLSSVLGSLDVTPYEMTQAYTVFANYGQYIPLHTINSITDSSGNVLFTYHVPQPVQIMDPRVAFMITSILSDNESRAGDFGNCSPLFLYPGYYPNNSSCVNNGGHPSHFWPAAAKTGTGQGFTDDWTMGYTMNYTLGVWAGNNNHTPMYKIDGITGAAPIWHNAMYEAMKNLPPQQFPPAPGMHKAHYCSHSTCTTDWFLDGPAPAPDLGEAAGPLPCVALDPNGGWNYSSQCDIHLRPGTDLGAP